MRNKSSKFVMLNIVSLQFAGRRGKQTSRAALREILRYAQDDTLTSIDFFQSAKIQKTSEMKKFLEFLLSDSCIYPFTSPEPSGLEFRWCWTAVQTALD